MRASNYPARSILIVDTSPFEQSLMLLPALRRLRSEYPNAFIVAATATGTAQLLAAAGLIQGSIDMGALRGAGGSGWKWLGFVRRVRRYDFDLVLDFNPQLGTQLVARLMLRVRTVSASAGPDIVATLMGASRMVRAGRSQTRYEALLGRLALTLDDGQLRAPLPREESDRFEAVLDRSGFRGGELLALLHSPGVNVRSCWPLAQYSELATRLARDFGVRIVVADEPGDESFTGLLGALLPSGSVRLAEPAALQLVAAVARASVVVTTSKGVTQLAAELGSPTVDPLDRSTDDVIDDVAERLQASRSTSLFTR